MLNTISKLLTFATLLCVFALPGNAALVGTDVSGSLTFAGDPSNYFDPAYGFVPATGYLNIAGSTVTISDTAVEFGFNDGASLISANFSVHHLTINDLIEISGANNGFRMMFTDAAFAGQYLIPVSDNFPIFSHSVMGDVMLLDYAGGSLTAGQKLTAGYLVAPVPEPSTVGLLLAATLLLAFFARRLRSKSSLSWCSAEFAAALLLWSQP